MPGPLDDVRVIDFGRYIAGPFCAALLGDMGAEVIRVEKRDGREDRTLVSLAENDDGSPREGAMFLQMNRNKKSLTLDPMCDAGREVVRRLVQIRRRCRRQPAGRNAEGDGPRLSKVSAPFNPRAILAVVSAFGLEGPYAARVGFDGVAQAMSGAVWFAGTPEQPVRAAAPWVDFGTASLLALGVVSALRARETTGRGQLVEGALLRTALTFFSPTLIEEEVLKINRQPTLNRSQTAGPSDIYRTKDGWITVAVNGDPLFRRAARLIGATDWLDDPRFASDKARGDHGEIISARVGAWVAERSECRSDRRIRSGTRAGRPGQHAARGARRSACSAPAIFSPRSTFPASARRPSPPRRSSFTATPGEVRNRPPLLGEHSDQILHELGYSPAEIDALKQEGAV